MPASSTPLQGLRHQQLGTIAESLLGSLIQPSQYVGEVYSLGFNDAHVIIHDRHRQQAGGIPSLSFLVATRLVPGQAIDATAEDSAVILLRVIDAGHLPNAAEAERVRVETAQRVAGRADEHWDAQRNMDPHTAHLLSFAGVRCRVIGTFYLDVPGGAVGPTASGAERTGTEGNGTGTPSPLVLRFGSDISNFYPNRGLKVYKPNGDALARIVNYRDPERVGEAGADVVVGQVRYASTNRPFQNIGNVDVKIMPADLLRQKTALFGMTRSGKSNTTKVILKSVFDLRYDPHRPLRVGQLVLDPNGEYANENVQDASGHENPDALKNIWRRHGPGAEADVVRYGITEHPNDPGRKLMLINFYADATLAVGKQIIDTLLVGDNAKYIQNFRQVVMEPPLATDGSTRTRYARRKLVYHTLLAEAGFELPRNFSPNMLSPLNRPYFRRELLQAMAQVPPTHAKQAEFATAATLLGHQRLSWSQLARGLRSLYEFIEDRDAGYRAFNDWYMQQPNASGEPWADEDLKKLLEMLHRPNGVRQIGQVRDRHTPSIDTDFVVDIYRELAAGRLVIVDQSSGDPQLNKQAAYRLATHVFQENQKRFTRGEHPSEILFYVEEAHNILPAGTDLDLSDYWVRLAKEGAKYRLGLVYATQEVSSIQRNILKNTANWFIGHLNNTDETKELIKYYDFADFEPSIRRAQDRGFLRVKTLSNLFVVPVQIQKFVA